MCSYTTSTVCGLLDQSASTRCPAACSVCLCPFQLRERLLSCIHVAAAAGFVDVFFVHAVVLWVQRYAILSLMLTLVQMQLDIVGHRVLQTQSVATTA